MAKNLYALQCPVVSEYDTETSKPGKEVKYIKLLPVDHSHQSIDMHGNVYFTNNSKMFWEKP